MEIPILSSYLFDVRCSSFKTTPYGINATCEPLQNNLALMDQQPKAASVGCALFQKVPETESGLTHKAGFSYVCFRKATS